jgi:hypothetical protein
MNNARGPEAVPRGAESGKSLKEQIRWQLWIIVAVNSLFLYGVMQANAIRADGLRAALTDAQNLVPIGAALVITTVLNGLFSADAKARLVFLRWHLALPGHRAFSRYAPHDARIDMSALERLHGADLPIDPVEQNRAWYRIYKTIENDHAVRQVHRDFLLLRDYTGLSAVFIACYGAAGLYALASTRTALIYLAVLVAQYAVVRQAASNYGVRMVTTVLARCTAKDGSDHPTTPKKRSGRKAAGNAATASSTEGCTR